ncbi:MAG: hypothetical protein CL724_02220 [Chloroflexi bacterium]|nr:hypothetical protein [Chloroflexota bacterium]
MYAMQCVIWPAYAEDSGPAPRNRSAATWRSDSARRRPERDLVARGEVNRVDMSSWGATGDVIGTRNRYGTV